MIWGKGKKQKAKSKDAPPHTTEADPMVRIEEVNADLQQYKEDNDRRVEDLSTKVQSNASDLGARVTFLREVLEKQGYIDPLPETPPPVPQAEPDG